MRAGLMKILRLGIKELYGLKSDAVMIALIVYAFTVAIYAVSTGAKFDVENAAIAVVDEDQSALSDRLKDALMKPMFKPAVEIGANEVDAAMDAGRFVFVVEIPTNFERDVIAGKHPAVQVDVDATAMSQAGNGASFIQAILLNEVAAAFPDKLKATPLNVVVRAKFNPNLESIWFTSVMQVINNITILSLILSGAALIREREHGTIEHLLVMPVKPVEILLSKIWANGLVIVVAATLCLTIVVERLLGVTVNGSLPLFVTITAIYLFSVTSLGILIATFTTSMAQFGLLVMPVMIVMMLLSGSMTPSESMPVWLQDAMLVAPSTHFVALAQAVLYRGAGLDLVWGRMLILFGIGGIFFALSLARFRASLLKAG
ncbi:MAG: ABC transporter permease [Ancalomicrobiaceae bacterium]|nr:ABC transporter permease [Ancalomicrobiaceae bacterium]